MSPLKNMAAPSPAKTHANEMHEKAGNTSNTRARVPFLEDTSYQTRPKIDAGDVSLLMGGVH